MDDTISESLVIRCWSISASVYFSCRITSASCLFVCSISSFCLSSSCCMSLRFTSSVCCSICSAISFRPNVAASLSMIACAFAGSARSCCSKRVRSCTDGSTTGILTADGSSFCFVSSRSERLAAVSLGFFPSVPAICIGGAGAGSKAPGRSDWGGVGRSMGLVFVSSVLS